MSAPGRAAGGRWQPLVTITRRGRAGAVLEVSARRTVGGGDARGEHRRRGRRRRARSRHGRGRAGDWQRREGPGLQCHRRRRRVGLADAHADAARVGLWSVSLVGGLQEPPRNGGWRAPTPLHLLKRCGLGVDREQLERVSVTRRGTPGDRHAPGQNGGAPHAPGVSQGRLGLAEMPVRAERGWRLRVTAERGAFGLAPGGDGGGVDGDTSRIFRRLRRGAVGEVHGAGRRRVARRRRVGLADAHSVAVRVRDRARGVEGSTFDGSSGSARRQATPTAARRFSARLRARSSRRGTSASPGTPRIRRA